jgi:hypothetical protein
MSRYEGFPASQGLTTSTECASGWVSFGSTKSPAHPEDRDRDSSETLENLHIWTQLSAQENFIEFCHCKNFKTYAFHPIQPSSG